MFQKYCHRRRHFFRHGAIHFGCRFQHVMAAVAEAAGPDLVQGAVGHVPYQVFRFFRQGGADIPADFLYPRFHRGAAEGVYQGLLRGEIFFVELLFPQIEIHPVRPIGQMAAQGDPVRRMECGLRAVYEVFYAIQMEFPQGLFYVFFPVMGHHVMAH